MPVYLWVFIGFILTLALAIFIAWVVVSKSTFKSHVKPGETYKVGDRTYTVPNLPHKTYGTNEEPSLDKPVPMLDEKFLIELRQLIIDTFDVLREECVPFWVTGGTLISALLWKSLMPYDDDADISVRWEDRAFVWSKEFHRALRKRGLEVFFLRGSSLKFATREGSVVRVRRQGSWTPTLDIFVTKELAEGKWAKINSWNGDTVHHEPKEVWEPGWLFPLREVEVDGMMWPVANQGEKCLDKQYGSNWNKFIQSPKELTATHQFIFGLSNTFGAWRVGDY